MKILFPILLVVWLSQSYGEIINPKQYDVDTIELVNRIPFDEDRYTVKAQNYSILEMIANALVKSPNDSLIVKGFKGEIESNYYGSRLSFKRAKSIKDALVNDFGIKAERIKIEYEGGECRCAKLYLIKRRYFKQVDFDNDRYVIKALNYSILGEVADSLGKNPSDTLIVKGFALEQIEGYYGQRLSYKRANKIRESLVNDFGIKEKRIKITFNLDAKKDDCKCARLYLEKPKF